MVFHFTAVAKSRIRGNATCAPVDDMCNLDTGTPSQEKCAKKQGDDHKKPARYWNSVLLPQTLLTAVYEQTKCRSFISLVFFSC